MNKVNSFFSRVEPKIYSLYTKAQNILNQKVLTISLGAFFKKPSPASSRKAVSQDLADRIAIGPRSQRMMGFGGHKDGDIIRLDLVEWSKPPKKIKMNS